MISSSDESNENVIQAAASSSENLKASLKPEAVLNSELDSLWFLPHGFQHVPPPSLHHRCPGQWTPSGIGTDTVPLPPHIFPVPSSSHGKVTSKNVWAPPPGALPFPWLQNDPPPPGYPLPPHFPEDSSFSKLKWRNHNESHLHHRNNNGYLKKVFSSNRFCPDDRYFRYKNKYEKFKGPEFPDRRCCRRSHPPDIVRQKFMTKFKVFRPNYNHYPRSKRNIDIEESCNKTTLNLSSDPHHGLVERTSAVTLLPNENFTTKSYSTDDEGIQREHEIKSLKYDDTFPPKHIFKDLSYSYWSLLDTADKFKSGQDNAPVVRAFEKQSPDSSQFLNIERIDPTTRYEAHIKSPKFSSVTRVIENFESSNNCGIQVHPQGQGQDEITKTR
ncbi:unnamed protein product [Allacma fusca]|uniref:Uncharacterized protein n=1 Tax=Allacma fusca TaxID=39272 RepID=A0A8J2PSU6_9HEXA|nr:unnamed protein product [Allacma fusca]